MLNVNNIYHKLPTFWLDNADNIFYFGQITLSSFFYYHLQIKLQEITKVKDLYNRKICWSF